MIYLKDSKKDSRKKSLIGVVVGTFTLLFALFLFKKADPSYAKEIQKFYDANDEIVVYSSQNGAYLAGDIDKFNALTNAYISEE